MRKISGISLIPINSILFLLGCIALTSFAIVSVNSSGNDKIVTDSCQFLGTTLRLIQEGNSAYLEAEDPSRKLTGKLKITPPCYFLRFEGKPETYAYKNIGVQGVLIVIGKIADVETKRNFNAPEDAICGRENQGILFRKKYIVLTNIIGSGGLICKDYGTDEKKYSEFAYSK